MAFSFHELVKRVGIAAVLPPFEFIHELRNCWPGRVAHYEYCPLGPPFLEWLFLFISCLEYKKG